MVLLSNPKRAREEIEAARGCRPDRVLARRLNRLDQLSQVTPRSFELDGRAPMTGFSKEGDILKTASSSDFYSFDLMTGQAEKSKHTWWYDRDGVTTTFAPRTGAAAFKEGNSVMLYDAGKLDQLDAAGGGQPLTYLNLSRDGKLLAAACADCIRIVDVGRRVEIRRVEKPASGSGAVAFTHAGDRFAAAFGERVAVWPLKEGPPAAEFAMLGSIRRAKVTAVAFGPKGELLALGASEGTVQLCSVLERKTLATFTSGRAPIAALAFSSNGRLLASGDQVGAVRLYLPAERLPIGPLPGADGHITSLDFAAPNRKLTLAVGMGKDGLGSEVRVFDLSRLEQ